MYLEKHHSVSGRTSSYLNHTGNLAFLWLWHFSDLRYAVEGKAGKVILSHLSGKEEKETAAATCYSFRLK